jgi:hypothetical protein
MRQDIASLSRAEVQEVREEQRRINEVELSWIITAIAREAAINDQSFDAYWTTAGGDTLSLGRLVEAQLVFYETAATAPEVPLLTERGYHFLEMLSVLFQIFGDDPMFGRYIGRCEVIQDTLITELLYRYDGANMPRRLAPVDYVIAAHVLEFLFGDEYYKPAGLNPSGRDFVEPFDVVERIALQNLTLLERRVGGSRVLGYALAMHALNALRKMDAVLQ